MTPDIIRHPDEVTSATSALGGKREVRTLPSNAFREKRHKRARR